MPNNRGNVKIVKTTDCNDVKNICFECNDSGHVHEPWTWCDGCVHWFHVKCQKKEIPKNVFNTLTDLLKLLDKNSQLNEKIFVKILCDRCELTKTVQIESKNCDVLESKISKIEKSLEKMTKLEQDLESQIEMLKLSSDMVFAKSYAEVTQAGSGFGAISNPD